MGKVYDAAFLIPTSAIPRLTDYGWEFESVERLPVDLISVLSKAMSLHRTESYLAMEVFEGKDIKLTSTLDAAGLIEHISVQIRGSSRDEILAALRKASGTGVRLFVPDARPVVQTR
jgi:hypothetical protein